jgi:hypothetical protein
MIRGQLLMRYGIALPDDYDMGIIRSRVRTRGSALDERQGLGCKAYCVREAGVDGSPVNEYAPFYLWADAGAAAEFLWGGPGFDGIVRDFGRPAAHTWVPAAVGAGGRGKSAVTHAVLHTGAIEQGAELSEVAEALKARVAARAERPETHLAFAGIDPSTWQTVEFTTTAGPVAPAAGEAFYSVLHVSQPGEP